VKHYFKSIDTWLEGVCKSFCKEHTWKPKKVKKKKKKETENTEKP
jgi:hypothetical protein